MNYFAESPNLDVSVDSEYISDCPDAFFYYC